MWRCSHLYFAGGCLGQLDLSWCAPADLARAEWALNETAVEGTLRTLRPLARRLPGPITPTGQPRASAGRPSGPDDQVYIDGYVATQRHFIEGLLNGTEHETLATDTLRTMEVVWTAYRSAEEGRTLAV